MQEVPGTVGWIAKFRNAFRGIVVGVRRQNSFAIHIPAAILVLALAIWFQLEIFQLLLLVVCITIVLTSELFNSAIEKLGKSITSEYDENLRDALDIASGAVLLASILAALIGATIFLFAIM